MNEPTHPAVPIIGANGVGTPSQADRIEGRLRQLTQAMQNLSTVVAELVKQQNAIAEVLDQMQQPRDDDDDDDDDDDLLDLNPREDT
jgi:hypothetical protein